MSLLADLLSKVKHSASKGEIPPNLRNIVHTSVRHSAYKRRLILISVFFVVFIVSGILVVYSVRNLSGISDKKIDVRRETPRKMVAGIDQQIASPPSEFREKREEESSVVRENSARKPEIETEQIMKVEKSQPVSRRDEKSALTEEKEIPRDFQTPHTQVDRIDVFEKDALLYTARDYELKKNYSKALSIYKKVLEMERGNVTVMNNIAYILLHLSLVEESIKYSQRAVDINKDYVPALINLGVAHTKLGDITAAGEYLRRASILEPDNQSVILNLAIFYEKQKDYDTASEYYTKLIRLGSVEGFLGLARVYEKKDNIEEALKVYKSIYSLDFVDDRIRILVDQRVNILNERLRMGIDK
jgi:tetratricopeptide (TPR) repeat protein